jgi:hypothetical protein
MAQPNRPPKPAAEVMAANAAGGVRLAAPLLLILSGDDNSGGHASWNRGRSLLREVDKKLAAASQIDFMVRALLNTEVTAKSTFQRAGNLSRRDIKRPASYVDFGRLLAAARALLKRDLDVLARSRSPAARPAVVLVAVDAPLADAITVQMFQDLVQEASVIWVVPERSADLMSPSFAAGDSQILTDHQGVAEEVVSLLRSRAASGTAGGAEA